MSDPYFNFYSKQEQKRFHSAIILIVCIIGALFICLFSSCQATPARAEVDLSIIQQIESSGNPKAVSRVGAIGLYQIMPCVLQEYNQFNKTNYTRSDLFNPQINEQIAKWYLTKRIPQMLRHFGKEINTRNCIVAYNAGIRAVVKGYLPKETARYLVLYKNLRLAK